MRQVDGVADVLSLTANPFDFDRQQSCLLVRLAANSEALRNRQLIQQVRARLGQEPDIAPRLRDRWSPDGLAEFDYPIDFAISGPDIGEVRELAEKLVEKLRQSTKLTDIAVNRDSRLHTRLDVDIDRTKAVALGLKPQEIADTVAIYTGSLAVGGTDRAGPRWYVGMPPGGQFRSTAEQLKHMQLRNAQGQMVPLGTVVDCALRLRRLRRSIASMRSRWCA